MFIEKTLYFSQIQIRMVINKLRCFFIEKLNKYKTLQHHFLIKFYQINTMLQLNM
jgi:hypothetical protein